MVQGWGCGSGPAVSVWTALLWFRDYGVIHAGPVRFSSRSLLEQMGKAELRDGILIILIESLGPIND